MTNRIVITNGNTQGIPVAYLPEAVVVKREGSQPVGLRSLLLGNNASVNPTGNVTEDLTLCKNFFEALVREAYSKPAKTQQTIKVLIKLLLEDKVSVDFFYNNLLAQSITGVPTTHVIEVIKATLPRLQQLRRQGQFSIAGLDEQAQIFKVINIKQENVQYSPRPPAQNQTRFSITPQVLVHREHNYPYIVTRKVPCTQTAYTVNRTPTPTYSIRSTIAAMPIKRLERGLRVTAPESFHSIQPQVTLHNNINHPQVTCHTDITQLLTSLYPDINQKLFEILANRGMGVNQANLHVELLAQALWRRLQRLTSQCIINVEHRMDNVTYKNNELYDISGNPHSQMMYLRSLESKEKRRKEDERREQLHRIYLSKSKSNKPEFIRLKEEAKQMFSNQKSSEEMVETNKTALSAIGSRRKGTNAPMDNSNSMPLKPLFSRMKKIYMRDMVYVIEKDRELSKSPLLYKAYMGGACVKRLFD